MESKKNKNASINQKEPLSLHTKPIKPITGVETQEHLHPLFYKNFKKHYKLLQKDSKNFEHLVLSSLFLHLTLESYITWVTVWLLKNINRRNNRRVLNIWNSSFEESAYLSEKVEFFSNAFLSKNETSEVKKIVKKCHKIADLRNRIVHGHEFSTIRWSNGKIQKSKFAELLNYEKVKNHYDDFVECTEMFKNLFETINIQDTTQGIPSKEYIFKYLTFKL